MSALPVPTPVFHNVQVIVTRQLVNGASTYVIETFPTDIKVTSANAVIGYQLVDPTPPDIRLTGYALVNPPKIVPQLSAPAISPNGRLMTLVDLNSVKADLHISLQFMDKDSQVFAHDPQIGNDPES